MMRIRLLALTLLALGLVAGNAFGATATRTSSFEYDAASGLLTKEVIEPDTSALCQVTSDNAYSRTYAYDTLGRVSQIVTSIDTSYTISYAYDSSGRLASTTYPTGFATTNVYNIYGYLSQVQKSDASVTYWQATALSALGRVTSETLGNGLSTTRNYDLLDRPLSITAGGVGGNVEQLTYQYDLLGNVTQRVDVVQGSLTENFTYDSLNRLTQVSGVGLATRSLNYDAFGNITYKSDVGTYTYPASGQGRHAVASISGTVNTSFTYDANGSLTAGYNRTLTYTSYNLPATIAGNGYTFTYTYNADHERVRLINAAGTSIYLHPAGKGQLLYEKEIPTSGATEHKHFITAGSILVGVYITRSDSTTDTRYFHRDHIDSMAVITNASGAVIERFAYEAFGKRRFPNGTADPNNTIFGVTTDRGFTTHEHLDEIALIHMNGRVYDPLIARFMTADPNIQSPSDLQSYNRYTYVLNNPLMYTDPSGYFSFKKFFRIAAAVAVAVFAPEAIAPALGGNLAAAQIVAGSLSGLVSSGNIQGAISGGLSAGLFGGLHDFSPFADPFLNGLTRIVAHGFVGGATSEIAGGDFRSGFLGAAFTQGVSLSDAFNGLGNPVTWEGRIANAVAAAVVGGTGSVIGGGKFANGAVTGAFSRLFNDLAYMGESMANNPEAARSATEGANNFSAGILDTMSFGLTTDLINYGVPNCTVL